MRWAFAFPEGSFVWAYGEQGSCCSLANLESEARDTNDQTGDWPLALSKLVVAKIRQYKLTAKFLNQKEVYTLTHESEE